MIDPSDVELAAMRHCLKAFGEAAGEIGFTKPLGDYSEAEALRVIDAIVTCWSDDGRAPRGQQIPARAGGCPRPIRWHPMPPIRSRIWRTTCLGRTEGEEAMMDFNSSSASPGQITALVDAGLQQARARQSSAQYLGPRASGWLRARAAVRVRQAPIDHGRDTRAGCCASSSVVMSWRTAWSRGCGRRF